MGRNPHIETGPAVNLIIPMEMKTTGCFIGNLPMGNGMTVDLEMDAPTEILHDLFANGIRQVIV